MNGKASARTPRYWKFTRLHLQTGISPNCRLTQRRGLPCGSINSSRANKSPILFSPPQTTIFGGHQHTYPSELVDAYLQCSSYFVPLSSSRYSSPVSHLVRRGNFIHSRHYWMALRLPFCPFLQLTLPQTSRVSTSRTVDCNRQRRRLQFDRATTHTPKITATCRPPLSSRERLLAPKQLGYPGCSK